MDPSVERISTQVRVFSILALSLGACYLFYRHATNAAAAGRETDEHDHSQDSSDLGLSKGVRFQVGSTAATSNSSINIGVFGSLGSEGRKRRKVDSTGVPLSTLTALHHIFVGRDSTLDEIHHFFTSPTTGELGSACVYTCVIDGLGGQGKTRTAIEYARRYQHEYDAVFWVNGETEQSLSVSYTEIARRLQQHGELEDEDRSHDATGASALLHDIEHTREWLQYTERRWLMIFDNIESTGYLGSFIPANARTKGDIIVTTQKDLPQPTSVIHRVHLSAFRRERGAELLFKILERRPIDEAESSIALQISDFVGGLPLAITTIGAYIKCSSYSPAKIFDSMKRSSNFWEAKGESTIAEYDKTLATVFNLALSELDAETKHFIRLMAFLDPSGVPEDIFTTPHEHESLQSCHFLEEDSLMAITHHLGQRRLIQREEYAPGCFAFSIHRSLQLHLLYSLKDDPDRQDLFTEAFYLVREVLPAASKLQVPEASIWPQYFRFVPQVTYLRRNSVWPAPPVMRGLPFARMLTDCGTFLWNSGQYRECEAAMETAEAIVRASSGDEADGEDLLSDIYLITGILADCVGVSKRDESLQHRRELRKLRQKAHDRIDPGSRTIDDEIRLWNTWGDLGCAHLQRGEFAEASDIFEKMHQQYKLWGTEHEYPFEYAKYYHHIAYVLMADGFAEKAIEYATKAVDLEEKHMESVLDASVLTARHDLACLLFNAGRIRESLNLHQQVLEDRKRICGIGEQVTLESHEAVGTILHLLREDRGALPHFEACLSTFYRANWTQEGIARAQYWYSHVLRALNRTDAADVELQKARSTRDQFVKQYGHHLHTMEDDEVAIFDQMLPIWIMQSTGKMQRVRMWKDC